MAQANTGHKVQLQGRVNVAHLFTGWLVCDNQLFDRICPQCRLMHSSFTSSGVCLRCNTPLDFIRISDGRTMSISEGTFGVALPEKQKARDEHDIKARKGGLPIVYRFKMFEFGAPNTPPAIPALHGRCKKGALIEVRTQNHQMLPKPFKSKEGWKVELMLQVFTKYGDKVEILADPKVADATVPHRVNADGSPAPLTLGSKEAAMDEISKQIAALNAKIAALTGAAPAPTNTATAAPTNAPVSADAPPVEDYGDFTPDFTDTDYEEDVSAAVAAGGSVDPFNM